MPGSADRQADVVVIGGGIAGLAAALRLKDRGRTPIVLEAEPRVGGRMTTDRVDGFVIDRGVTLLGKRFERMTSLAKRLRLGPHVRPGGFVLGLQDAMGVRRFRSQRPDDLLLAPRLSVSARRAVLVFLWELLRNDRRLAHGHSERAQHLDRETAGERLRRLGAGGVELLDEFLEPAGRGAMGGSVGATSWAVFLQAVRNTLASGFWNLDDGVDRIPEALAAEVEVVTNARAKAVSYDAGAVTVDAEIAGQRALIRGRAAIVAVPGHLVPALCPQLPEWIEGPLSRTRYASMASAHVALRRQPRLPYSGYAISGAGTGGVVVMELEHLRVPESCPGGAGMVSAYYAHTPAFSIPADDEALRANAIGAIRRVFPECANDVMFVHVIRWPAGIAQFPAGRLTEMVALRRRLASWNAPIDFCGDYLDGVSSEGALCTGEQAAERVVTRVAH